MNYSGYYSLCGHYRFIANRTIKIYIQHMVFKILSNELQSRLFLISMTPIATPIFPTSSSSSSSSSSFLFTFWVWFFFFFFFLLFFPFHWVSIPFFFLLEFVEVVATVDVDVIVDAVVAVVGFEIFKERNVVVCHCGL